MTNQNHDNLPSPNIDEINATSHNTMVEQLGIKYTLVSKTRVEATMPVNNQTCQPFGLLHGGASLALAETLAGVGTMVDISEGELAVGQQVNGNHIAAARIGDTVRAEAVLIHRGRTSRLWNVDIYSTNENKLVSTARVLYCIIKKNNPTSTP
ncbi:MAG: PaaI family thioesterase [Bacteroidaceae bacterium]